MTRIDGYLLGPRRTDQSGHTYTTGQGGSGRRFDPLAALFDPTTFRHLERLGVVPGWRCWEVGAGGTSVLDWLAKRVGATGQVLRTDLDTTRASAAARHPVTVVRHDIATDEPPGEGFDLVYARLVLAHVTDQERALRSMIRALRPGGRLLVEDTDTALQPLACPDEHGPDERLANRLRNGLRALRAERGTDLAYGRKLPRLVRAAGLKQVAADVHFPLGTAACADLEAETVGKARDRLVAEGFASAADIDRHLARVAAGGLDLAVAPMVSVWGRKG
ncbi:methyltransferase domain-containing protein [Streptomyces sp. NPDC002851]